MVRCDCSCVKFKLVWKELRLVRKLFSSSVVSVQIMNMSSMYRLNVSGLVVEKYITTVDMYMFAMVGEKAAPIAVPFVCWNVRLANVK